MNRHRPVRLPSGCRPGPEAGFCEKLGQSGARPISGNPYRLRGTGSTVPSEFGLGGLPQGAREKVREEKARARDLRFAFTLGSGSFRFCCGLLDVAWRLVDRCLVGHGVEVLAWLAFEGWDDVVDLGRAGQSTDVADASVTAHDERCVTLLGGSGAHPFAASGVRPCRVRMLGAGLELWAARLWAGLAGCAAAPHLDLELPVVVEQFGCCTEGTVVEVVS